MPDNVMRVFRRQGLPAIASVLLALLAACNPISERGESGANEPPTVDAGADQSVVEAASISLSGTASDADGSIATIAWAQSAGPAVMLSSTNALQAGFVAPSISETVVMIFRLTVSDDLGASTSDTVTILVDPDPALNEAPIADAGPAQSVGDGITVTLDGSASSDADGSVVAFSWIQIANDAPAVSLLDATAAVTTFTAPDVLVPTDLVFELVVTDNEGALSTVNTVVVTVIEASGIVELSGQVTFDNVPHAGNGGLDYNNIQQRPARAILVEAVDSSNQAILATTSTNETGYFSLSVPAAISVFVRARAQMRDTGAQPAWDFSVVDNDGLLDFSASKSLYVLDSSVFNSGVSGVIVDLHAESGWDPTLRFYSNERSAAPFAILDVVYDAWQLALGADPALTLQALVINWSPRNSLASNSIGGSFFANGQMFVLGAEEQDTDEYDRHVVAHEFGHFFEDAVSRTDSVGGPHSLADQLDGRVALSEGWGNAYSAMVTGDDNYQDSCCLGQASAAVDFSLEDNCEQQGESVGWYSECSVGSLIYDFFDPPPGEVEDTINVGFLPIYQVLAGSLKASPALTTVFSFVQGLKDVSPANSTAVDTLLQAQNIQTAGQDEYGSAEIDDGGNADALPLYRDGLTVGGAAINVCSNNTSGDFNKLGNRVYVRLTIDGTADYRIHATTTESVTGSSPDPDFNLYLSGYLAESVSAPAVDETLLIALDAGEYVLEVWDDNNISASQIGSLDPGRYCADLSVTVN